MDCCRLVRIWNVSINFTFSLFPLWQGFENLEEYRKWTAKKCRRDLCCLRGEKKCRKAKKTVNSQVLFSNKKIFIANSWTAYFVYNLHIPLLTDWFVFVYCYPLCAILMVPYFMFAFYRCHRIYLIDLFLFVVSYPWCATYFDGSIYFYLFARYSCHQFILFFLVWDILIEWNK